MSLVGDLIDGVLEGTGWAAGVAIVVGVAAVASRRDSPLAKNMMKGYMVAADRARELVAEAGEQLADLYAEARAEYEAGTSGLATAGIATAATAAPPARRRGRPPRAATEPAPGTAEAPPRRRGRPPRAQSATATEAVGTAAPRRGRRPRAAETA